MDETIAQQKFACPACGGEAVWNPSKQALICPFCGTTSPAKLDADTGKVIEHDLVAALRGIGDDKRGWQAEKRYVKCQSCQAISVLDPQRQGHHTLCPRSRSTRPTSSAASSSDRARIQAT